MPFVSVIIPNYNHAPFLRERIESVLNQTYNDFELIIMDDKSSDNSIKIIEDYVEHPKVSHVLYNSENSGSTFKQWEKGIKYAKGDVIWLAESDDVADLEFLSKLAPLFKQNTNIGIAYCQSNKINGLSKIVGTWETWTSEFKNNFFTQAFVINGMTFTQNYLIHKNVIPNASAVLFKKEQYLAVGGVTENIKTNNDWLLWLKMSLMSEIAFCPDCLNSFRFHEHSVIFKAVNTADDSFIGHYNRYMRVVFSKYLLKTKPRGYKKCISLNKKLTAYTYLDESIFEFRKQNIAKGLSLFTKAFTCEGLTFWPFYKLVKDLYKKLELTYKR